MKKKVLYVAAVLAALIFYLAGKGRQQAARAQGHGFESDGGNQ